MLLTTAAAAGLVVGWFGARAGWGALRDAGTLSIVSVEFEGARHADRERLERRLAGFMGRNILAVNLAEVREKIKEEPWIKDTTVQRVFPDRLLVHLVERTAMAVDMDTGQLMDDQGFLIEGSSTRQADTALPQVTGGSRSGELGRRLAIELLHTLARSKTDLLPRVDAVDVSDTNDLRLVLRDSGHTLHLGTDAFTTRLNRYLNVETLIAANYPEARSVDLRFDERVVLAPVQ